MASTIIPGVNGMLAGRLGRDPVAMITFLASKRTLCRGRWTVMDVPSGEMDVESETNKSMPLRCSRPRVSWACATCDKGRGGEQEAFQGPGRGHGERGGRKQLFAKSYATID